MKDAEEEATVESEDHGNGGSEAEAPPVPTAPMVWRTHQRTLEEMAKKKETANPSESQEESSSVESSSGVQELEQTPPQLKR